MAATTVDDEELVIYHPNRGKATSKATKGIVTLLLLASAGLVAIITFGGWSSLQGDQIISIAYVIIYCVMAYFVSRWSRGMLPLTAALAIILLVFAVIAAPGWFDRSHTGYDNPGLPPDLIGLLTAIIVPVQLVLIAFAMRGFTQEWNVEIEMTRDEMDRRRRRDRGNGSGYRAQPQG
jgi:protein-S-isoprenylcysteine O-methyltransferase Ste14